MAKTKIHVTLAWQEIATSTAIITIEKRAKGTLMFNQSEDETTAYKTTGDVGEQFMQDDDIPTYVRADREGWEIIVDEKDAP